MKTTTQTPAPESTIIDGIEYPAPGYGTRRAEVRTRDLTVADYEAPVELAPLYEAVAVALEGYAAAPGVETANTVRRAFVSVEMTLPAESELREDARLMSQLYRGRGPSSVGAEVIRWAAARWRAKAAP